jgi:hypothetical protein
VKRKGKGKCGCCMKVRMRGVCEVMRVWHCRACCNPDLSWRPVKPRKQGRRR